MLFIIGALIALGVLVIVHEAGHFIAARSLGVNVVKFSIGFGPKLLGYKYKGTNFMLSLIPLGGYVKMSGDEPSPEGDFGENDFYGKVWWKRIIIVAAGPFANLLLGVLLYSLSFGIGFTIEDHRPIIGRVSEEIETILQPQDRIVSVNNNDIHYWSQLPKYTKEDDLNTITFIRDDMLMRVHTRDIVPLTWYNKLLPEASTVIGSVAPGMPAYRAGLKEGDRITAVDGHEVESWYDMRARISDHPEDEVVISFIRNDEQYSVSVGLDSNILLDDGQKMIGITQELPVSYYQRFGLIESLRNGVLSAASFVTVNCYAIARMITKPAEAKTQVGGPVMIVLLSRQTAEMGWGAIFAFVAAISLVLMIVNLLPVPALDGGHILLSLIEGISGKPLSFKVQMIIQQIGVFLLIALMIFIFYNDISRLVGRSLTVHNQENQIESIESP